MAKKPSSKPSKPTNFIIVDSDGAPLGAAKIDVTIADAVSDMAKRVKRGAGPAAEPDVVYKKGDGYVTIEVKGVASKGAFRKVLYSKLHDLSQDDSKDGIVLKKYQLKNRNGALVVFDKGEADPLEAAPSDSIGALQQLAKFFLP